MGLASMIELRALRWQLRTAIDDWTFTVAPYLWATGLEGEVATLPSAAPAEIDLSFSDVLEDLDLSLTGLAEVR